MISRDDILEYMRLNGKTVLEASEHFEIPIEQMWCIINKASDDCGSDKEEHF